MRGIFNLKLGNDPNLDCLDAGKSNLKLGNDPKKGAFFFLSLTTKLPG